MLISTYYTLGEDKMQQRPSAETSWMNIGETDLMGNDVPSDLFTTDSGAFPSQ
jgi:hypothetical protein